MKARSVIVGLATLALMFALAACGGGASDETPTAPMTSEAAASPSPTPLGKVADISELVSAYEAAGGVCKWVQTDAITLAVASGTCREPNASYCEQASDWSVLSVYRGGSDDGSSAVINGIAAGDCPQRLLVGPNWIINANDVESVAEALGGELFIAR